MSWPEGTRIVSIVSVVKRKDGNVVDRISKGTLATVGNPARISPYLKIYEARTGKEVIWIITDDGREGSAIRKNWRKLDEDSQTEDNQTTTWTKVQEVTGWQPNLKVTI
jgi:hypothetical protein